MIHLGRQLLFSLIHIIISEPKGNRGSEDFLLWLPPILHIRDKGETTFDKRLKYCRRIGDIIIVDFRIII